MPTLGSRNRLFDPKRLLPIIVASVAVSYAVAAYFLLIMPKLSLISAARGPQGMELDARLAAAENRATSVRTAVASFAALSAEKKELVSAMLPMGEDVPDILVQIDAAARAHGMAVSSIDTLVDPKKVSPAGRKTVSIAVNLSGGLHEQFKGFLADIERSQRLFDVQSVLFTPGSDTYSVVLRGYFFAPAQEEVRGAVPPPSPVPPQR